MLLVFLFFSFFDFFVLGLYARFMNALYNLLGASSNPQKKKNRFRSCKKLDFGFGFCRFSCYFRQLLHLVIRDYGRF